MALWELPRTGAYLLRRCSVPRCFLAETTSDREGEVAERDIHVAGGKIVAVTPPGAGASLGAQTPGIDVARAMLWPCFADLHCHLDKGQIIARTASTSGTFAAALEAVSSDKSHWHEADTLQRMEFGLRCAFAHGSAAMRTHIDSDHPGAAASWAAFAQLRDSWAGRIELQAVSLVQAGALADPAFARRLADRVARSGGILGASTRQLPELAAIIDTLFRLAQERGLPLDFHVDETGDPGAAALSLIAQTAIRRSFAGTVVVGHCCSLAVQDDEEVERTLALVAQAGLAVVTLPVLNLQLQDRQAGRTPRWRGITLVHEMRARGIPVAIGGDNVRDPLHPYGDHDMLAVYRCATLIGQLDAPIGSWPGSVTTIPRAIMGLPPRLIGPGYPADFVLYAARSYSELLARPQADRLVVRGGRASLARLPDFRELDPIMARRGAPGHAAP